MGARGTLSLLPQYAVARDAWGRPSRVCPVRVDGFYVIVKSEDGRGEIGCPKSMLYDYDEGWFAKLAEAHAADSDLAGLWSVAESWAERPRQP